MNVLLLGDPDGLLAPMAERLGCRVSTTDKPVDAGQLRSLGVEFCVCYRYRHIIPKAVIDVLPGRMVNLHVSLLPWNRGADPNLWSFLEDTPGGVTIHVMDEGLDTGPVLVRERMSFGGEETLASTYAALNRRITDLLAEHWSDMVAGRIEPRPQPPGGSYHRLRDKEPYMHLLRKKGWETPVGELVGKALKTGGRA